MCGWGIVFPDVPDKPLQLGVILVRYQGLGMYETTLHTLSGAWILIVEVTWPHSNYYSPSLWMNQLLILLCIYAESSLLLTEVVVNQEEALQLFSVSFQEKKGETAFLCHQPVLHKPSVSIFKVINLKALCPMFQEWSSKPIRRECSQLMPGLVTLKSVLPIFFIKRMNLELNLNGLTFKSLTL